ncbi:hypothetical protein J7M02_00110 [Candidatus Aerophobetes bacterium]|nr:hypothetical protein [Candidatus Aerophobetes bacterium]
MKKIILKAKYGYFVEEPCNEEGHRKKYILGSYHNDNTRVELEICECQLKTILEDLEQFKEWIEKGKKPEIKGRLEERKSYIG